MSYGSVVRAALAQARTDPAFGALSAGERDALVLMAEGRSNGQISAALALEEQTVRDHVSALLRKVGWGTDSPVANMAPTAHIPPPWSAFPSPVD